MAGKYNRLLCLVWIMALLFVLSGCAGGLPGFEPTPTETPVPTYTITPTEVPTATLTPLPPIGLLLSPTEADPTLVKEVQDRLSQWIPGMGYRFQVRQTLSDADLEKDDFRLIVALPPNPGIAALTANHPEIQFLTLGIQGLDPASNLTTIGADGERLDFQGFIAGYMAAMITPDWRVGVIGFSDSQQTIAARQAFFTGVKFYCGLCLPDYPPFYEYPLFFELGSDADTVAWRTAADYMIHRMVATVYVVPGAGDDAMYKYLADAGVNIIAPGPVKPGSQEHWVASLRFDLIGSFDAVWSQFSEGTADHAVSIPLEIAEVNPDLLSPGKQQLVEKTMLDLLAGYIDLGLLDENIVE